MGVWLFGSPDEGLSGVLQAPNKKTAAKTWTNLIIFMGTVVKHSKILHFDDKAIHRLSNRTAGYLDS
jgi:hypothetical protein